MPITKETFRFMAELWENNNKKWFDNNRQRYIEHVREPIKELASDLTIPVHTILPDFNGKPKISRINADIRFHPKKKPYKEHIWMAFREDNPAPADMFVYIDRAGWGAGAGIGALKKEPLDNWRRNLIEHVDTWKKYGKVVGLGKKILIYTEGDYRKPLFPNIPDDVFRPVQAKGVWIVEKSNKTKRKPTDADFFNALCRVLPVYTFMSSTPKNLTSNLKKLDKSLKPHSKEIEEIWKAVS